MNYRHRENGCYWMNSVKQGIRFLLVGILNFGLSYLVYASCIIIGFNYLLSNGISFCFSVLNSFVFSQKFVFKGEGHWAKMLFKVFLSFVGTGLVLQSVLLIIWIEVFEISSLIAPLLNIVIITPINFVIQKYWAYK